jgi:hypothetical protein
LLQPFRLDPLRDPASLMPFFFAALRYALANAWKGLVLAELFASTKGGPAGRSRSGTTPTARRGSSATRCSSSSSRPSA